MKKIIIKTLILFILTIFIFKVILLPISKNPRILILDQNNNEIMYLNNLHKTNIVSLDEINKEYIKYIIQIEDKDFYKHHGFSIKRIIKALFNNIKNDTTEGASTITQQYIKNTYLTNEKSITRKTKEIILSINIESKLKKDEILEEYLSCLYFGNNVYGIKNASKYYYNKSINNLSKKEIISLIALWNSPTIFSNNYSKWNHKKNNIAKNLYDNNLISYDDYKIILEDIKLDINKNFINSNLQYYVDQVINEFNNKNMKSNFNEIIYLYTEYNPKTNIINSNQNINYSIISSNKNGYITSCIGNNNYNESTFNIAINGNRDIGSTIKPILYYEMIKCGFENKKYTSSVYSFKYNNEIITIKNNSNRYYNLIDLKTALAVSDNIYAIKSHLELGTLTLKNHLKKYNIESKALPSLALGSVGMSLYDLLCIYFQFFNDGYYTKPIFIKEIKINNKSHFYNPNKIIINDKSICNKIKNLLSYTFDTSIKNSTLSSISNLVNTKCYGKTGTTDYDSYTIGFNDDNIVAIWVGDINNNLLNDINNKKLPKELFYKSINALS